MFHDTQTATAMAVVVTMVATVVGAVVHAVKVRISVPSLYCFCSVPNYHCPTFNLPPTLSLVFVSLIFRIFSNFFHCPISHIIYLYSETNGTHHIATNYSLPSLSPRILSSRISRELSAYPLLLCSNLSTSGANATACERLRSEGEGDYSHARFIHGLRGLFF